MTTPDTMPILLIPGLASSARVYLPVLPALWRIGPVTIANHLRDDSIGAIARRILDEAPPRFALAGHSLGGYIAFEIMRQAPERVAKLALINTQARPDTPEGTANRRLQMAAAQSGHYDKAMEAFYTMLVHPTRRDDADLRKVTHAMFADVTPDEFVRQQTAIIGRADSRPTLSAIDCPTLVLTGDQDLLLPHHLSEEMAQGIAGAKLVTIPECGHMPQFERPEQTTAALVDWLRM